MMCFFALDYRHDKILLNEEVLFSLLFALITGYWKWNISYKTTDFALLKGILLNALVYVHDLFIPTD